MTHVILVFKNLNNLVLIAKPHNLQTMNVEINEAISPKSNNYRNVLLQEDTNYFRKTEKENNKSRKAAKNFQFLNTESTV